MELRCKVHNLQNILSRIFSYITCICMCIHFDPKSSRINIIDNYSYILAIRSLHKRIICTDLSYSCSLFFFSRKFTRLKKKRWSFDILIRITVISACSPIRNKLRVVSVVEKAVSLFVDRTRTSCNCFVIREHTIETESSRGLFGVKLLVLAALGGPLVAERRYFYGWSLCERKGKIETDALLGVYTLRTEINRIKQLFLNIVL